MNHFIFILSFLYAALMAFMTNPAWATYDNPTCDSVCSQIVDTSTDQILNTSGADGWTSVDTAWCAANPINNVTGGAAGTTVASLSANATTATDQNRCQYHDSQVLNYCLAYEATASTDKFNIPLLALDIGAAATCGIECFNPTSSTLATACRISSTAASAAQLLDGLTQSNSGVTKDIGDILGAAGLANEVMGVMQTAGVGGGLSGLMSQTTRFFTVQNNSAEVKLNSCISFGVMSAMAAMRVAQLASHAASKQSSCQNVLNLLSTQPVITATTGTASGQGGSTASGSVAGSGGSIIGSGAASPSGLASTAACAQNGISTCADSGQMSAATDGGLMSSTGLDQTAGAALGAQDLPALANAINSGQSAGSMIGGAMKGQGVDGAIDTIKGITDDMQKNLASIAMSPAYSSGGASGGTAKPAQSAFGKGFDFGNGAAAAAPTTELKFNRAPSATADGDIWHEGYKGSIFQIVSTRIVETKDRVTTIDWSTPLNRALMGLPAQKKGPAR